MNFSKAELNPEEMSVFMDIVESSLRVTRRDQLFNWLQGGLQYLLPHEVLICGISDSGVENFSFESFSSILYPESYTQMACQFPHGLVFRVMSCWQMSRVPIVLGAGLLPADYGIYNVPDISEQDSLSLLDLNNMVAHGSGGQNGSISTFFCFCKIAPAPGKSYVRMLELLTPYLHSALVRVYENSNDVQISPLTEREQQVLHWVKRGKTNWEIAQILGISLYTVKNHVQNILRKLNVQNRGHAAVKANSMMTSSL